MRVLRPDPEGRDGEAHDAEMRRRAAWTKRNVVRGDATVDVVHDFIRPNEQFAAQAIHPPADIIRARAMGSCCGTRDGIVQRAHGVKARAGWCMALKMSALPRALTRSHGTNQLEKCLPNAARCFCSRQSSQLSPAEKRRAAATAAMTASGPLHHFEIANGAARRGRVC
jgi:hypothetical protein